MDKFTKLILNGIEKFVSAIYDGSGNEIETTYETKTDASSKNTELSGRIDTISGDIESLTSRVESTEAFSTSIEENTTNIQTNAGEIENLKTKDGELQGSVDSLTLRVVEVENTTSATQTNVGTLSSSFLGLNNTVSSLKALVEDEAEGIGALNTQADENTANIAALEARIAALEAKLAETDTE